jgi:hypothetical protein
MGPRDEAQVGREARGLVQGDSRWGNVCLTPTDCGSAAGPRNRSARHDQELRVSSKAGYRDASVVNASAGEPAAKGKNCWTSRRKRSR